MATFKYTAYDSKGKKVEALIDADSMGAAQLSLKQQQGLMVSTIKPVSGGGGLGGFFAAKKTNYRDLEYLTSEIKLLLQSGVKFDKAVDLMAKAKTGSPMGEVLSKISAKLKAGSSIADAFSSFGKLFNKLYINLLTTGEESGALEPVFAGLSRDLKYRNDLRQTITQAVTYPFFVLLVCVASVVFIFNFIVPKLAVLFDGAEDLPLNTQIILALSDWMIAYQHFVALGLVAIVGAVYHYRNNAQLIEWFHVRSRNLSGVGTAVDMTERIRFCSSMSLLLDAGIAMDKAVKLSAGNAGNSEIRRELTRASDEIRKGTQLSKALSETSLFPDIFISLIEIGEESGQVAKIFQELADRSRNEFGQWVNRLTAILEPALILTMGAIVGGVVISMMMSVMSVNDAAL